jgi:hypothetical protein
MTPKQFRRYLDRDGGCLHCGEQEAVAPHHRSNRGMGGSKARDVPSNIIVLCSYANGLLESDAALAAVAREYGWKVSTNQDWRATPVYDLQTSEWLLLTDGFERIVVKESNGNS